MRYFSIILSALGLVYAIYEYRKKNNPKTINGLGAASIKRPPKVRIVYSRKQNQKDRIQISSSSDVYTWLKKLWNGQIQVRESMYVLYLDRANKIIGYDLVSLGGINGTVLDIRLVLASALNTLSNGIILAHNHPSGQLRPSNQDIQVTQKLKDSAQTMDIALLDHLIITSEGYYSFADEGDL
jgi:DNA repair protein RadC